MTTDQRVDAYIAAAQPFARPVLAEIRARLHAACPALEEMIKWSRPSFLYRGQIMAGMAAFKAHLSFGFWQGVTLPPGTVDRISSVADLPSPEAFAAMVHQAMALIDAGAGKLARTPRAPRPEAEIPPALAEALAADPAAAAMFNGFAPSCRRDYCEWIAEAKRDATRDKRVAEAIGWLREGKRRNWKYENC